MPVRSESKSLPLFAKLQPAKSPVADWYVSAEGKTSSTCTLDAVAVPPLVTVTLYWMNSPGTTVSPPPSSVVWLSRYASFVMLMLPLMTVRSAKPWSLIAALATERASR